MQTQEIKMTIEQIMVEEYERFINDEKLTPMDAEELLMEELTPYQRMWVSQFIVRWDTFVVPEQAAFYAAEEN